jgi:hypothetical protein
MKTYPHLNHCTDRHIGSNVWAFDKKDGSNIRAEWSKKNGWYKFGTRKCIIDNTDENFGEAIDIFMNKYSDDLAKIFTDNKNYRNSRKFTVFMEYFGPNSFAGQHVESDIKDVLLFDVVQFQKGFIAPKQFVKDFGDLGIPDIIYKGELTTEFIQDVKNNVYNLDEGVMCKGVRKTKGNDVVWMAKIKTKDWLDKLKEDFGEDALLEDINNDLNILNRYV